MELHLNKKPKRAWENWLNFPPSNSKINYERKLELAKENISRKGRYRTSKFNEAHFTSLQIYEGPYEIKKQVRPGTYILWNPESKEERGMFHSQDLKIYNKREKDLNEKDESEIKNVG